MAHVPQSAEIYPTADRLRRPCNERVLPSRAERAGRNVRVVELLHGAHRHKLAAEVGTFFRCIAFIADHIGLAGNLGSGYFPNVTDTTPVYRTEDGGANLDARDEDRRPGGRGAVRDRSAPREVRQRGQPRRACAGLCGCTRRRAFGPHLLRRPGQDLVAHQPRRGGRGDGLRSAFLRPRPRRTRRRERRGHRGLKRPHPYYRRRPEDLGPPPTSATPSTKCGCSAPTRARTQSRPAWA